MFEDAVALHEGGRLPEAEQLYQAVLQHDRNHFGSLHLLGVLRAQQGRLGDALTLLGLALAQDPGSAEAHNHAGSVLHALKRTREALSCFDKAIALDGDYAEAHYNRGVALQALGRPAAALACYRAAAAAEPQLTAAHFNAGTALRALGRPKEAVAHYRSALAIEPDYARAHAALGVVLQDLGRHEEAVAHGRKALSVLPEDAAIHNTLGLALQALERHREALAHLEKAVALRPGFAAAHNNLGIVLQALNRHDEAILQYRKAIAANPRLAQRHANMGMALQEMGRFDEARSAFKKAIELAPATGRFYRNLADCTRFTAADPELAAMEKLGRDIGALAEDDRRQLLFALGKAAADLGRHEEAFAYWQAGNALKRRWMGYDEAAILGEFERIRAVFDRGLIMARRGFGDPSPAPVFILGMPRSGTTLVEQILASHSQVFGAGELLYFGEEIARLAAAGAHPAFPELVPALSGEELRLLGTRYLGRIAAAAPPVSRITDKMPLNFRYIGLIHLALPKARIIHTRRDPVDTCLSCFATLFPGAHRVACELGELGRYYRAYAALMRHWHDVLPEGAVLDVQYENMVEDVEREARRIVAHCGLAWEEGCLDFYRSRRPVRTASVVQVRQPIYRNAIGRWHAYAPLLHPLLEALGADPPAAAPG
ncbi:MAG: tetratricopeptide repeat-containing sulfotransferase family protein [Stellaceae bacterium]